MELQYRSLEINHLAGALAKAQGSYKKLIPNQTYKNERFANLDAIFAATRESLSNNGLCFSQIDDIVDDGSGIVILKSLLIHESGQWLSSWSRIVPASTERDTARIYEGRSRRHASRLLGIAPSDNDPYLFDDNGESEAQQRLLEDLAKPKEELTKERTGTIRTISDRQYNELLIELRGYDLIAKQIMDKQGIGTLADLPEDAYHMTQKYIRTIKKELEEDLIRKRK
jgi:hypothetical protein